MKRFFLYKMASAIEDLARTYYPTEGSHGWNHIEDVVASGKRMLRAKGEKLTPEAEAALMFHDSGLYPNGLDNPEVRYGHERRGATVARRALKDMFDKETLLRIAAAIREHRGSYKGEYTSPLSDLVSSADRGKPDLGKKIMRSWTYGMEHGYSPERAARNVVEQVQMKYGTGGYARMPSYYQAVYQRALDKFHRDVDALTEKKVLEYVKKHQSK